MPYLEGIASVPTLDPSNDGRTPCRSPCGWIRTSPSVKGGTLLPVTTLCLTFLLTFLTLVSLLGLPPLFLATAAI